MSKEDASYLRTNMQMIFQDPMACLNPRKKVKEIIAQGLEIHHVCSSQKEVDEKVYAILEKLAFQKNRQLVSHHSSQAVKGNVLV